MNLNLNGMVSMWKVRELVDKATNIVMNYTETEAKVRLQHIFAKKALTLHTSEGEQERITNVISKMHSGP